jgi:hypothetical protein
MLRSKLPDTNFGHWMLNNANTSRASPAILAGRRGRQFQCPPLSSYILERIGVHVVAEPDGSALGTRALSELRPDVLIVESRPWRVRRTCEGLGGVWRPAVRASTGRREISSPSVVLLLRAMRAPQSGDFLASGADECLGLAPQARTACRPRSLEGRRGNSAFPFRGPSQVTDLPTISRSTWPTLAWCGATAGDPFTSRRLSSSPCWSISV